MQRIRQPDLLPSNSGSVRNESDKRRPRAEDEWLEEPTSQGPPYELVEIQDKGKYTEQRYGNADVYWNSVMVEASEEEKERRRVAGEGESREKRNGRIFENTEQLYQAYNKRQRNQDDMKRSSAVPEQKRFLSDLASTPAPTDGPSHPAAKPNHDANEDPYITLTENTSVAELNTNLTLSPDLTWNSALTQILASPGVDSSVSSGIRARAHGTFRSKRGDTDEVDMREVSMVPSFSYPLRNARWCDACQASYLPSLDRDGQVEGIWQAEGEDHLPNGRNDSTTGDSDDDVSFLDLTQSNDMHADSLYRVPTPTLTPTERRTSDPGSVLRDILDAEELEMYQEIMSHNPRFTMLLDWAENRAENVDENRQVPLITKLCWVIEDLTKRLADFEGCGSCRTTRQGADGFENLCVSDPGKLVRAFDLMDRVLKGCWKRECSLLNTLLDIQERRNSQSIVFLRLLTRRAGAGNRAKSSSQKYAIECQSFGSLVSSGGSETASKSDASLSKKELDTLLHIATQNVTILREDLGDVCELLYESDE